MAIERRAQCPTCGRPVRLTEAELIDKRGFCAVCDARFEILPETLVGDGPLRSTAIAPVAHVLREGPPLARIRVSSAAAGRHEVSWTPNRLTALFLVPFTGAWWAFLAFWYSFTGDAPWIFRVFPLLHVGVGVFMIGLCAWALAGRESIELADGRLRWRRGIGPFERRREVALADVSELRVVEREVKTKNGLRTHHALQVALLGAAPIELGQRMEFERDHVEWLRAQLAASIGEARRLLPHAHRS